jgi:signal transduction histidine kinase
MQSEIPAMQSGLTGMNNDLTDIVRVLRIAAWMWIGYLLALILIDAFMYANTPRQMLSAYYLRNGIVSLVFLCLSYWSWIEKTLGRYYVPLMLLIISGLPIAIGRIFMPPLPPGPMSNIEGIALRMLPILFIALVITAWQYTWRYVVIFAAGTAGLEIAIVQAMPPAQNSAYQAVVFIAIVRSVSFLVVGYFISRLMHRLQKQQDELAQANAQLTHYASTLENLTVSRERNRVARELHDTLAHTLSGLTVQMETIKAYWEVDPLAARKLLDQSLYETRSGLQETRRALKALRASPLEDLGLRLALRQLAEAAAERANLSLEMSLPEDIPNLSPDVEQCLFRITQEAIDNVVQHADAKKLAVRLAYEADGLLLEVQDDGIGFNLGQNGQPEHFGLPGMRERAQLVGGLLMMDSKPGQGTTVKLVVKGHI